MTKSLKKQLTNDQYKNLQKDIDLLRKEITSKLGNEDVDYIKKINQVADISEIVGRTLLHTPFYKNDASSRGEWYFRQIMGTTDIKLPKIFDHQTVALIRNKLRGRLQKIWLGELYSFLFLEHQNG